jgi:hypothetical protein
LIYYILCTYVSPPTSSFSPVAVYPPLTIEEEDARLRDIEAKKAEAGELYFNEKTASGLTEKEVEVMVSGVS